MALTSFSITYLSLSPVFQTLKTASNETISDLTLSPANQQVWDRALTVYGFAWSTWAVFGVLCLVIWLWAFLQTEDSYSFGGGYY